MPLDIKRNHPSSKTHSSISVSVKLDSINGVHTYTTYYFPKIREFGGQHCQGKRARVVRMRHLWERLRRKILAVTKNFDTRGMYRSSIFVRHHQNGLDCVGLAHEPRAISPQYSSISRFGTPGPKLQTVTLSLKTHSSISVSVDVCVDPLAHGALDIR